MKATEFLHQIDERRILEAVREAEQRTSGEVRVFVTRRKLRGRDVASVAREEFHRLDMDTTEDRNAVLFYLAPRDRAFAVIGDEAVHALCGPGFWEETARAVGEFFRRGEFTDGLLAGIERASDLLAVHFPRGEDDRNELSDRLARD
jgi:uncharacterized membrane protein